MKKFIKNAKNNKGFTLLEILLAVAALAILSGIVIFAINPAKQLADARNEQRRSDVSSTVDATIQYSVDEKGVLPTAIPDTTAKEICKTGVAAATCTTENLADLSVLTASEKYLVKMPVDPQEASTSNGTGYTIVKSANGRVTVTAPTTEKTPITSLTSDISVTK